MATPKRGTSIEKENPFRPGSEIRKEVDDLLRSSTISGDQITIVDPSSPQYQQGKRSNGDSTSAELTDNEHVLVTTVNSPSKEVDTPHKDGNDNEPSEQHKPSISESNGLPVMDEVNNTAEIDNNHTVDETDNVTKEKKKKKKKSKKTCQII